jgi:hypothetical protein
VVDVTRQILLDREVPIRRGHQDFILHERWNCFPEWIEVHPAREPELAREFIIPGPVSDDAPEEAGGPLACEREDASEQFRVEIERQEAPRRGGFIAALFGRQK